MTRSESIDLTTIITHLCLSHLCRLHSEFIRLLFLQSHRENDCFFFSFRSSACATKQWTFPLPPLGVLCTAKSKKSAAPSSRLQLYGLTQVNIDGTPITSRTHTHPSHSQNLVYFSIFKCSSSPRNPAYARLVDSSVLVFSLSSHRHYRG
jgi:hypothetical protein